MISMLCSSTRGAGRWMEGTTGDQPCALPWCSNHPEPDHKSDWIRWRGCTGLPEDWPPGEFIGGSISWIEAESIVTEAFRSRIDSRFVSWSCRRADFACPTAFILASFSRIAGEGPSASAEFGRGRQGRRARQGGERRMGYWRLLRWLPFGHVSSRFLVGRFGGILILRLQR